MVDTVVLVSDAADGKGGASAVALRSARILAEGGLDVRLFAGLGPLAEPTSTVRTEVLTNGGDLIKASTLVRATRSLWNAEAADRFAAYTQDLDPRRTVVHVHSFQFQLTASVVRRAMDRGFPVVMTAHDYGLACPYSGFFNYNTGRPCGKVGLSMGCATTLCNESRNVPGKLWHMGKGWLQRGAGRVPSGLRHLAFVSELSRRVLTPYLPPGLPTSIVRNPVDIPSGPPRAVGSDAPYLYVGRLTREKGGETFAAAAKRAGVPAVFVGTGAHEDAIRTANPDAIFLGWRSPSEVREAMRAAKALVFPSRWFEGQPLVVQEAQAVGLPVLTATGNAAEELVVDGVDGRHFPPGDVGALTVLLRAMDVETSIRMGRAAYDRFWQDPPTPERHLAETLAMYAEAG
ncbi:MAG: glycosyltransferase family 4 protein [Fimbriimonas sp.]